MGSLGNETGVAVAIKGLRKSYKTGNNTVEVLRGLDIEIPAGTFVSIMGPSGSGKSTLLYLIGGLDSITAGSIEIFGKDLTKMTDGQRSIMRRRSVSFIFQFYNLIPTLTALDNVLMPIVLDRKRTKAYNAKALELLESVGLGGHDRKKANELSGGQQQRVAIARSLICDPQIILADEPTGNLDSKSSEEVLRILSSINRESGKTILMVTHSRESDEAATAHIRLKDGELSR